MISKAYVIVIIFNFLIIPSSFGQITKDVRDFVRSILLLNNPMSKIDTIPPSENLSHIIPLEKVNSANGEMVIYKFGWNYEHVSRNYILIANGPDSLWTVLGANNLEADLVKLKMYFDQGKNFKESTQLACYDYLVANYSSHLRTYIKGAYPSNK